MGCNSPRINTVQQSVCHLSDRIGLGGSEAPDLP